MSLHKLTRHAIPSVLLLLALGGISAVAQNSPSLPIKAEKATGKEAETLSQRARRDAEAYEFRTADADRPLVLRPGSMLQWTNPLGGRQAGGDVFLWTDRGRPEAVLSIYEFLDQGEVRLHHEFCSLSLGKPTAMRDGATAWSPEMPGIELRPLPAAEPPEESRPRRLRQMRALAGRFSSEKKTREGVERPLRLLPQPVYRYEGDHPDVLDAALFALVEATDPEALLLIEARREGGATTWNYALARLNSIQLTVSYQDAAVWEAPELPWRDVLGRPDQPYTILKIR